MVAPECRVSADLWGSHSVVAARAAAIRETWDLAATRAWAVRREIPRERRRQIGAVVAALGQPALEGEGGRRGAVADAELPVDVGDMPIHRRDGDDQLAGDLPGGPAPG